MRRVGTVVLVIAAMVLTGCTSQAQEPPGLTASPTPSPTPSPEPEPTAPVSETQDLSDPEAGIVFEDVPVLTGDEAAVWNTAATFQREYWQLMRTNTASPGFSAIAFGDVVARMEEIAANNAADSVQIGGTYRTRVSDVTITGDEASVLVCDMYADVTFSDHRGPATPEEAGFGENILLRKPLRKLDGRWMLGPSVREGTC